MEDSYCNGGRHLNSRWDNMRLKVESGNMYSLVSRKPTSAHMDCSMGAKVSAVMRG